MQRAPFPAPLIRRQVVLDVQRVAQRLERGFLKPLALRRMRMDGSGDVFQPRAHFHGQRKRGRQFGDAMADGLNAEDEMIAGGSHHPDKALLAFLGLVQILVGQVEDGAGVVPVRVL